MKNSFKLGGNKYKSVLGYYLKSQKNKYSGHKMEESTQVLYYSELRDKVIYIYQRYYIDEQRLFI